MTKIQIVVDDSNLPSIMNARGLYILSAILVIARISYILLTHYTSDDAFITYRYAANLAEGNGFVYNIGEKVQGSSSPLYTIMLAAAGTIGTSGIIPIASGVFSLCADIAILVMLWMIFQNTPSKIRFLIGLTFALYPKIVLIGISGMEAPIVVMLMLISWHAIVSERYDISYFSFFLLLFLRLDAILWIAICLIWLLWRRKLFLKPLILLAILYGSWIIFCQAYFGAWIPHSVIAKQASWNHLFPAFDPIRIFIGYFPSTMSHDSFNSFHVILVILFLSPVAFELYNLVNEKSALVIFPTFFLLYNLFFSFGRVFMTDWYYFPGYVSYIIIIGSFVKRFLILWQTNSVSGRLGFVVSIIYLFALCIGFVVGSSRWSQNLGGLFVRQNRNLGIWLRDNATPQSRVLVEPIGYVGWESKLYIYDYIGLVSPQIVAYRKQYPNSDAWYLAFLKKERPEFIVQRNWEEPRNLLFHGHTDGMFSGDADRSWFRTHYKKIPWNPRAALEDTSYLVLYKSVKENIILK